jgi:hypothetical protein
MVLFVMIKLNKGLKMAYSLSSHFIISAQNASLTIELGGDEQS